MRPWIIVAAAAAAAATPALAQSSTDQSTTSQSPTGAGQDSNSAVRDTSPRTTDTPAEGANSFTEDQARDRLAKAGYTNVATLSKNDNGQWTGTATRGSRPVRVMLDYKGNISTDAGAPAMQAGDTK